MVERLLPLGLSQFRVSLDGAAPVHDARRPFRGRPGSSHGVIMANLAEAVDLVRVTPIVTCSASDPGVFAGLLDDLAARALLHRLARPVAARARRPASTIHQPGPNPFSDKAIADAGLLGLGCVTKQC